MITGRFATMPAAAYRLSLHVAQRAAMLREAASLIVQAEHMRATISAELDATPCPLPPDFCAGLRVELTRQDAALIDVLVPGSQEPTPSPERNPETQPTEA